MEEINFTESQLRAVNSLKNQYILKGVYIGVALAAISAGAITLAVTLVGKYSHLIYKL